jgi:hypothetical protein
VKSTAIKDIMSKQRLEGKVAIITGGGGGIASAAGNTSLQRD